MAGTHEGGVKAAETREKHHPGSLSEAGRKGAMSPNRNRSEAGRKAVITRRQRNEQEFIESSRRGGQHSRRVSNQ